MILSSPFPFLRFSVGPIRRRREDGVLFEVGIPTLKLQSGHHVWLQGRGGWRLYDGVRLLELAGDGELFGVPA